MYTIPDPRSQCDLILFPFHGVPLTENPAPFFLRDDEMNLGIRIHTYISTCLCIILSWSLLCAHYYRAKVMLEELLLAFSACLSQNYKLCRASCRKDVKALFTSRQERKKWDIVLDLVTRWLGRHTPTWSSSLVCFPFSCVQVSSWIWTVLCLNLYRHVRSWQYAGQTRTRCVFLSLL